VSDPNPRTATSIVLDSKARCVEITCGDQPPNKYTGSGGIDSDDYANVVNVIGSIGKSVQPQVLVLGDESYIINSDTVGRIL